MRWSRIVAVLVLPIFLGNAGKALAQSADNSVARDKQVHTIVTEIAKWADDDVIWLDHIYALQQGFPPAADMVLVELSANSGQFTLKGRVRRADDISRAQFRRLSLSLQARAKLGDLIEFMYEFYSAGFLHQIRAMDIKPILGSRELEVELRIEALSLPTAESKGHLPKDAGSVLKSSKLSDYREPIVARDCFAYSQTARATVPEREKTPDPANFVVVAGFTEVDGAPQVWLRDRIAGKQQQLKAGENFTMGNVKGAVKSIDLKGEVVIEFEGHRRLLHLADNLRGGEEIPDSQPNQPKGSGNSTQAAPDRDK